MSPSPGFALAFSIMVLIVVIMMSGCATTAESTIRPNRFAASDGPLAQAGWIGALVTSGNPTQRQMGLDPVTYNFPQKRCQDIYRYGQYIGTAC